uniref:tetratricopeptide repeat protein n=1 Tax=Cyanobium sp. TaxID=2164130 RepID=UPI0040475F2C
MTAENTEYIQEKFSLLCRAEQPEGYLAFGRYLHSQVDYPAAIRAYTTGLEIDPGHDELHCMLGLTYHNQGNHQKAIRHYRTATQLNPGNAEANYYLGFILIQESKTLEAISYLKKAIALHPKLNDAYHFLGIALERTGEHKQALAVLQQCLTESYPAIAPQVFFTIGELLSKRRQYECVPCHAQACADVLLETLRRKHLHCFGDSHRSVFNNLEGITCYNVGAGTAYNLISTTSTTGAGNKILKIVDQLNSKDDALLLVFGEIDCMEHIYKNAFRGAADIETLTKELAMRFLEFAKSLGDRGFEVLVYGPAFSGIALNSHGSLQDRNKIVKLFNKYIKRACANHGRLAFASLDHLLIGKNLRPRLHFSDDGRHLDHFPKGSKVLQGILLSSFINSVIERSREPEEPEDQSPNKPNLAEEKPFSILHQPSKQKELGESPVDLLQTGLLSHASIVPIKPGACHESALIVDLLDHLPINSIHFTLVNCQANGNIKCEFEVIGISKDAQKSLGQHKLEAVGKISIDFHIEHIIARAVWIRFQWDGHDPNDPRKSVSLGNLSVV